jgi:SAM-dependent methyltransferase
MRGVVLDVGCGRRPFEQLITAQGATYIGVDWPAPSQPSFPDIVADANRLPLRKDSVDSVIATEIMEHLESPSVFLDELARVLKPGGILVLTVPFLEPLHEIPRDFYRFTPFSLERLCQESGFRVEQILKRGKWASVVIGSLIPQILYDKARPPRPSGGRARSWTLPVVLPVLTLLQLLAYAVDQVSRESNFALGFTVLATCVKPTTQPN